MNFSSKIKENKVILLGEIHGSATAPEVIPRLTESIAEFIFCAEYPFQADKEIFEFLNGKTSLEKLKESSYLKEAFADKRLTEMTLALFKKLHNRGIKVTGLEDYSIEITIGWQKDEMMAKRILNLLQEEPSKKLIALVGNIHILSEEINLEGFQVRPIKTFFSKEIKEKILAVDLSGKF